MNHIIRKMNLRKALGAMLIATSATAFAANPAPKYIFYYIGDGMGIGHVASARLYNDNVLQNQQPLVMTQFPVASFATTNSASSDVTDSAAAGTALSTGYKTKNGMLGMNPDTVAVTSMAKMLFDKGYGVGLVTSVAIDDATPGAFYAHVPNRGEFRTIGQQLAESGYQFAAGSSLRGTKHRDGSDNGLLDIFEKENMKVVYGMEQVDTVCDRLLILSHEPADPSNVGYTIDSIPGALTLPDMTRACISHLERTNPGSFFMMVEGGNIDHAGHANDGGTIMVETINFDQALRLAYDFYKKHPDETLIVVTADHETGGMTVGNKTTGYSANFGILKHQKVSKEAFSRYCQMVLKSRMAYHWSDMEQYLHDNFGFWGPVKLTDAQTDEIKHLYSEIFEKRNEIGDDKTLYADFNAFSTLVYRVLNDNAGAGFNSNFHTGNAVPVFAIGVGAERFSQMNDNTDIPRTIMEIAGLPMQ